jgi:hypothetical protein
MQLMQQDEYENVSRLKKRLNLNKRGQFLRELPPEGLSQSENYKPKYFFNDLKCKKTSNGRGFELLEYFFTISGLERQLLMKIEIIGHITSLEADFS